jgi:putative transposase
MPTGLKRFQQTRQLHYITFSCYRRQAKLVTARARSEFERSLKKTRRAYGFGVVGYVVMPEHVHLLVSEPEKAILATGIQALKQSVSRRLALRASEPFWQARYYDFNVWSDRKRVEKLRYIHRNPVKRGLVAKPEDWEWSSYRHYAAGVDGAVEVESEWTASRREQMGLSAQRADGPDSAFPALTS